MKATRQTANLPERNIAEDLSQPMCCGCGLCSAMCPADAIKMGLTKNGTYYPSLNETLCTNCGKCRRVCPGIDTDWDGLNGQVFGKRPEDGSVGNFLAVYKGYAAEHDLRQAASSGGAVTAVLEFLFSQGRIDAALVTRLSYGDEIRAEPFWATSAPEIRQGKGSKYCPVTLDKTVKELRESERRVAVVCLPCHAIGLRKAMALDPRLQKNIRFIFSLFCNQTPSYRALDRFLDVCKMTPKDVTHFQWRGDGWPGTTKAVSRQGVTRSFFFPDAWSSFFGSGNFTPWACYCCYDFFGEFSDISFGDAWLPETRQDKTGTNVFIVRTAEAQEVIKQMAVNNLLHVEDLGALRLKDAFAPHIRSKKAGYQAHRRFVPGCPRIRGGGEFDLGPGGYWHELKRAGKILMGNWGRRS